MIESRHHGEITVLRIDHGKVNAMDIELLGDLVTRFAALSGEGAPPVVLTGAGRVFSAGLDLHRAVAGGAPYIERLLPVLGEAFRQVFEYPAPVVAALNGHAIAGGGVLACCCDYRVMARGTNRIGVPELHVGVPFPSVALEAVRYTVAPPHLGEVIYGGVTFDPEHALAVGLVDEIAEPDAVLDAALARATHYAAVAPETFALTKRQLRHEAIRRYGAAADDFEPEIVAQWLDPAMFERMGAHIERTLGRG